MCARAKPSPGRGKAALHPFRVNEIMRCVAIDIFGPLSETENGNQYIIVLGGYYSEWADAWSVPNHTAQTVAHNVFVEFSPNSDVLVKSIAIKVENSNMNCFG